MIERSASNPFNRSPDRGNSHAEYRPPKLNTQPTRIKITRQCLIHGEVARIGEVQMLAAWEAEQVIHAGKAELCE